MSWRRRGRGSHGRHRHHRGRGRRLFWRIYLHGFLLLLAVGVAVGLAGKLLWTDGDSYAERVGRYLVLELSPLVERPEEAQRRLDTLHEAFGVDVAVYRDDGTRLAAAGNAPPPLDPPPPGSDGPHWRRFAVALPGTGAYLTARLPHERSLVHPPVLVGLVLLVLAVVSLPLARWIVRPIERLTQAARAIGQGDLSVRTGLCRRDELGTLARAFDDMAARLERTVKNERELLANVSHELRTPMARIRVALELLEEDAANGNVEPLEGIRADLAELEQLLEDVLETARLDVHGGAPSALRLRVEPCAPRAILEEAASRFAAAHPEHRLEIHMGDAVPDEVRLDPRLVRRVLDNLLDNTGKYADATAGSVELCAELDDEALRIEVKDRGIGVDAADLPLLFEPFFRTDKSRSRGTGGVGLGLALCRRIAEAHGGSIEATRREGGGLVVRLTLPLAP